VASIMILRTVLMEGTCSFEAALDPHIIQAKLKSFV
jgi:hypothetical protein